MKSVSGFEYISRELGGNRAELSSLIDGYDSIPGVAPSGRWTLIHGRGLENEMGDEKPAASRSKGSGEATLQ